MQLVHTKDNDNTHGFPMVKTASIHFCYCVSAKKHNEHIIQICIPINLNPKYSKYAHRSYMGRILNSFEAILNERCDYSNNLYLYFNSFFYIISDNISSFDDNFNSTNI